MSRKAGYQRARRARLKAAAARESGSTAQMTPQDRWLLDDIQEHLDRQNKQIPKYLRYGMTDEQIRAEVIKHVESEGALRVNGRSVSRLDVDARFPKPQDSRYDKLVNSMNSIDLRKVNTDQYGQDSTRHSRYVSWHEDYFRQTAERLTAGYSTKELGEFVRNELKETVYSKGGRSNYQTAIMLALQSRFISYGDGKRMRNTLGEPGSRLSSFVSSVRQALTVRSIYQDRADVIRAKYKR